MDGPDDTSELTPAPRETMRQAPRPMPARAFHQPRRPSELAPETPPPDPFSEIAAEASNRSMVAVEKAITGALNAIRPHPPVTIAELPAPIAVRDVHDPLGRTIPRRMLEPRLEVVPPPPAFDGARADHRIGERQPEAFVDRPAEGFNVWQFAKRALRILTWLVIGWLALVVALLVLYRFVNPPVSALMVERALGGAGINQTWTPIEAMSSNIVRAVIVSEDARFCQHAGIDFGAIEDAIENTDGRSRGGSTISMQVVKNLFLWPSKSYVRKAIELPLTLAMEALWPKARIMEVYLNIAEWGPGVFGIGAAAQYHFRKPARALSVREAARLAVALPNPFVRNPGRPGPGLQRLANAIEVRMRLAPRSQIACALPPRS
jgi:monofunctional glycosyltransferase